MDLNFGPGDNRQVALVDSGRKALSYSNRSKSALLVRQSGGGVLTPAASKRNMIVLFSLYPVVFLLGVRVEARISSGGSRPPFWLALSLRSVVSVLLLDWLAAHAPAVASRCS